MRRLWSECYVRTCIAIQFARRPPVRRRARCCNRRLTFPGARQSLRFFFTAASKSAGREALCGLVLGAGVVDRFVLFSTAASRVSKPSANNFTPPPLRLSFPSLLHIPPPPIPAFVSTAPSTP